MANPRISFDFTEWIGFYPEFQSTVSPQQAQGYFDRAGLYIANDGTGPIINDDTLKILLYLTVAHLAQMYSGSSSGAPSPLVGRLNSASEGSVSVGTDLKIDNPSAQWWIQTRYGFDVWSLLAPYRVFRYEPGPVRVFDPVGIPGRFRGGF